MSTSDVAGTFGLGFIAFSQYLVTENGGCSLLILFILQLLGSRIFCEWEAKRET